MTCTICRCQPRSMSAHLSTLRHRRATRPKAGRKRKARAVPDWTLSLRLDPVDFASPEQLAAAEAWASGA